MTTTSSDSPSTHWLGSASHRRYYLIALAFAAICNILALALPFMQVRQGFDTEPYNLIATVIMMAQEGLWVLSLIVVLFSIVFPFFKLACLGVLIKQSQLTPKLRRVLVFVERVGKWSMVDIFIVSFILALAKDQLLLAATPSSGLIFFLCAILTSMTLGALLTHRMESTFLAEGSTPPPHRSRLLIGISFLAFVGLLAYPFIGIDDWLLRDHHFTVLQFLWALTTQGAWIVALVLLAGLVIIPAYELYLLERRERLRAQGANISRESALLLSLRPWSLIDVFLFSLILFLIEGQSMMGLEVGLGTLFLLIVIGIYSLPFFTSALSKITR